jgi:F-box associated protein
MTLQPCMKLLRGNRGVTKPQDNTLCQFLALPVDIVGLIIDHLGTFDRFRLSHTCRSMREFFGGDQWRTRLNYVQKYDPVHHAKFVDDMVFSTPGLWKCMECGRVHRLDHHVTTPTPSPEGQGNPRDCKDPTTQFIETESYKQMHVQLAVNLHRLNRLSKLDHISQEYLEKLMAPVSKEIEPLHPQTATSSYRRRHRVIKGHFYIKETARFSTKWSLVPTSERMGREHLHNLFLDEPYSIRLCQHLTVDRGLKHSVAHKHAMHRLNGTPFNTDLERAIEEILTVDCADFSVGINISCRECPTDCELRCSGFLGGKLTFRIWKNLGKGEPGIDMPWLALDHATMPPGVTYVPHERKSIRQAWEASSRTKN